MSADAPTAALIAHRRRRLVAHFRLAGLIDFRRLARRLLALSGERKEAECFRWRHLDWIGGRRRLRRCCCCRCSCGRQLHCWPPARPFNLNANFNLQTQTAGAKTTSAGRQLIIANQFKCSVVMAANKVGASRALFVGRPSARVPLAQFAGWLAGRPAGQFA